MPVAVPQRELPYSSLDRVSRLALNETYQDGAFSLIEGVAQAVAQAGSRITGQVAAFAAGLEQTTRSSRSQLTNVHEQLARGMKDATLARYSEARAAGRMVGAYRLGARDAGGRLGRAIASADFCRGTYDGIGFANIDLLDREARQWHRLNYGAGGAAGPRPRHFGASLGSVVIAALGLEDSPSAPFALPPGVWTAPGGSPRQAAGEGIGWFFPQRGGRSLLRGAGVLGRPTGLRPTKGIRAWNFLDAGVEFLAANLGEAYGALYSDWWDSAQRGLGPLSRVEDVRVVAPRRLRSGAV